MRTKKIIELKAQGLGRDAIYEQAAGNEGLFAVAFFGHKAKPGDKAKLNRIWKRINAAFGVA